MRKQRVAASFLGSNKKSFWKEISKFRGRTTRIALSIDGYSTSSEIANCFASKCSSTFSVGNGVKQGGVLSPVLFTVYLDGLIDQLTKKVLGCHFNVHFVGGFIYADAITLFAPSRDALNNMLDVCREYAEAYDILFNATTTKCMFFIERIVLCLIKMFIFGKPYMFC